MNRVCCYDYASMTDIDNFISLSGVDKENIYILDLKSMPKSLDLISAEPKIIVIQEFNKSECNYIAKRLNDIFRHYYPFVIIPKCSVSLVRALLQYELLSNEFSKQSDFKTDTNSFFIDNLVSGDESYEF